MEGLLLRVSPGPPDPVVSAFDHSRDWASEAEQQVVAIQAPKALSGITCNSSAKSQNTIL